MSHENHCQWECSFCLACFPTNNSLQQHFEEYRLRAAELERCKSHAEANGGEQVGNCAGNGNDGPDIIKANTKCPYPKCGRKGPFTKGQQLRVHFRTHITCEEVCVCCFKVFRIISEYIRHTRQHNDVSATKRAYMDGMCSELRKLSDNELKRHLPHVSKATAKRRRRRDVGLEADMDTGASGSDREARPTMNGLYDASSELYRLTASSLTGKEPADASKPADVLVSSIDGSDMFVNIPTEPYQPTANDQEYDPPLFTRLNFPQYPRWMDESIWLANMSAVGMSADAVNQ